MSRLISLFLLCSFLIQSALANSNVYIRTDVMGSIPATSFSEDGPYLKKKPNKGLGYNFGVGYKFGDLFRSDVNFMHLHSRYKAYDAANDTNPAQSFSSNAVLLNNYLDLNIHQVIKPYITVGFGYGRNKSSQLSDSLNDLYYAGSVKNNFVWNSGVGTRISVNNILDIDFSYKYMDLGKVEAKSISSVLPGCAQHLRNHTLNLGLILHI